MRLIVKQFKITPEESLKLIDKNGSIAYEDLGRKVCKIWSDSFKPANRSSKPISHGNQSEDDDE